MRVFYDVKQKKFYVVVRNKKYYIKNNDVDKFKKMTKK